MNLFSGLSVDIGGRSEMQDAHCLIPNFQGQADCIFGGVYDGHMEDGGLAANFVVAKMPEWFGKFLPGSEPGRAFIRAYRQVSRLLSWRDSGVSALSFFIRKRTVYFANAGDCRLLVLGRTLRQLTNDHRLSNDAEHIRILGRGTKVDDRYIYNRDYRIMLTRSLGDSDMRRAGVIPTPEVGSYRLKPSDRFLLAACDGLFDEVSNEEIGVIADMVDNPQSLADMLFSLTRDRGMSDNFTAMVLGPMINLSKVQLFKMLAHQARQRLRQS